MSSDISVDENIFSTTTLILNFNLHTFLITMAVFLTIILVIFLLHGLVLVPRFKLKGFDFDTGKKKEFRHIFRFVYMTYKTFFNIALGLSSKLEFIRVYGIDVLNFLNFETKMFVCTFLQCGIVLISAWAFQFHSATSFQMSHFLTGQYLFTDFYGLYLFYAVSFNVILHFTVKALYLNAKEFHLDFILENKDLNSRYSLIANVCYISRISRNVKKQELERDLMQLLGIYPSDFILVLFPRITTICEIQMEIDNITDVFNYHQRQDGWWFKFWYSKKKEQTKFKKRLSELHFLYKEEAKKPPSLNGRGMIFFYRIGDVEMFHRLNKEFTVTSRFEAQEIATPLLKTKSIKSLGNMKKVFLFSYNELIIRSLDIRRRINNFFRVGFYILLFLLLVFVSTPNMLIQKIINLYVDSFSEKNEALTFLERSDVQVVLSLVFPLITTTFNLIIIILIEQLGQFQKFTRHSSYQCYMIRFAFIYLLINMFIIPGFALGTDSSLFQMFYNQRFSILSMFANIRLEEKGQYFATFIVQTSVSSFVCYMPILKEIARNRFSYELLFQYLKEIRRKAYRKLEPDLFEFGYNYSSDLVIIYIMAGFGIFQPLLFFAGAVFFLVKGSAMVNALTSFYKGQSYAKTKYLDRTLNRLRFAPFVGFFFIAIKGYIINNFELLLFAASFGFASFVDAFTNRGSSFKVKELFLPHYQIKLGSFLSETGLCILMKNLREYK